MHPLHRLVNPISALVLLCGVSALAQNIESKPLIVEKINENQLVTLRGNTPPPAIGENDRGRVDPSLPMSNLILVLRRSPEQQAAFDAYVASQYDATSPNFHQWLEPEEVGVKFGPSSTDIATVFSWLSSHGLSVDAVSKDRMTIRFSGTAGQVQLAFHTEIHNLTVRGESHIANMSDPQIPMALEPVVVGPKALHNFLPRPLHRLGSKVMKSNETGQWERVPGTGPFAMSAIGGKATPHPDLGINLGAVVVEDMTPFDFAKIYNITPLWNSSIDGTGQTIAVAGRSNINVADVNGFRALFGLPAKAPTVINNGADPGQCTGTTGNCTLDDQIENALDVEWSGAIAKGADVDLVVTQQTNSNDAIFDSSQYVIQNKTASILNVSYGLCELGLGTAGNATYNNLWQTAATEGIAVFTASGDSGSPACDSSSSVPFNSKFGLAVSGIASTPFDTAVGGTDFTWCNPTATVLCASGAPFWGTTDSATTGANVQSYIPEVPWNDTCTTPAGIAYIKSVVAIAGGGTVTDAESACNYIKNNYVSINTRFGIDLSFFVNVEGAGGGVSSCTTSDGSTVASCSGGYAKPVWQSGVTGIPSDNKRDIPDVSFFAAAGLWDSAYIICVSAAGTCFSSTSPTSEPTGEEIGGTSASTPAMAGVMALINQKAGSPQGNPNSELYKLAGHQTYSSCSSETGTVSGSCYFNDVDSGTIAMACTAGSPNCNVATSGDGIGILTGYGAAVGYDQATGLGTMNVANVVNGWSASTGTGPNTATVSVTASPSTFTTAQGTAVTVTVTGSSGIPTGTVFLTSGSFGSATRTLTNGSFTFSLSPGLLAAGTETITATYSGDAIYGPSTGTTTVTVTQVTYSLSATTPAAITRGSSASSTVTVSTANGYVGAVTLTCALTSSPTGAADLPTCAVAGSPVNLSNASTSGTGTVTVSTTGATAAMKKPPIGGWAQAESGALLALLVFFGIPVRRRGVRATLAMVAVILALGGLTACGSGSSRTNKNPGTSAGNYTFTVTGTGNPAVTPAPTTTFTVTIN